MPKPGVLKEKVLSPFGELSAVYNPAVIKEEGTYHLFARCEFKGKKTTGEVLHFVSDDGRRFVFAEPALSPDRDWDAGGCEDPRIVKMGSDFLMTYVGVDGKDPCKICLATSRDLRRWEKIKIRFRAHGSWNRYQVKAGVLFPEKISGFYWLLFLGENEPWASRMGVAFSKDLVNWEEAGDAPVISPRSDCWDSKGVEPGAPPFRLGDVFVAIYNGWDENRVHRAFVAVFDGEDPLRVLKRPHQPLLEPLLPWEKDGKTPMVVFAESALLEGNILRVYYGAADTHVGLAEVPLSAFGAWINITNGRSK